MGNRWLAAFLRWTSGHAMPVTGGGKPPDPAIAPGRESSATVGYCRDFYALGTQHHISDPAAVRQHGVIDLPTMQRYLNFHFSVTVDLFGADVSSNAATFYTTGLKGRFDEHLIEDDHQLGDNSYDILEISNGQIGKRSMSALTTLNERLRDDYIADTIAGVARWNRVMHKYAIDFQLTVPHKAFNRQIGSLAGIRVSPAGQIIDETAWQANVANWLWDGRKSSSLPCRPRRHDFGAGMQIARPGVIAKARPFPHDGV